MQAGTYGIYIVRCNFQSKRCLSNLRVINITTEDYTQVFLRLSMKSCIKKQWIE